ncbi:MAG: hypothetical protein RMK91_10900 [Pseudanabaenaceae cyanobacterium SKYGB_i_bin29]|nr:hypothetical protein [Pseudanabaenaceae cyanobacterium SKYG29]MDW8422361.1 hypothetical protein [Pseudanabaenaceae cyanobacterium SKYGB_i_bin29]
MTLFTENVSLTSSNNLDSFLFPLAQGSFFQQLTTDSLAELWQYHLDGETFLQDEYGVPALNIPYDIEQIIASRTIELGKTIASISLY